MNETLRDQHGPYGTTVEDLKAYVLERCVPAHTAHGWRLTGIDYRKEMHHQTGRYRYIAIATYERTAT